MGPTHHYRLSPSASKRWLPCPFSAQNDLPNYSNAASEAGDIAHEWAAKLLVGQADLHEVPEDCQYGVSLYAETMWAKGIKPILAERGWVSLTIPEFGGTIDCLMIDHSEKHAVIGDYKNGRWPVGAEGNTQLLCYATIISDHFDIDTVEGIIVQPNASRGSAVKSTVFTKEEIDRHRDQVAEAAVSDDKCIGEHCRFCPLRMSGQCDEGIQYGRTRRWPPPQKLS